MIANIRVAGALWTSRRPLRTLAAGAVFCLAAGFVCGRFAAAGEPAAQVAPLVAAGETIAGEKIVYPAGAAKVTAAVVTLAPGASTGWHTHGVPAFGYVLEGELTVDYGEKGVRVYRAGDAVLEAIDIAHDGRNTGAGPMRILAVFMGAEGLATSVPVPGR